MKKVLLLFVFALLATVAAQAQTPRFGVRVGANYSGFGGDDADNLDRLWGFHGGVTSQFGLTSDNFIAIQPELLFSMKGAESQDDNYKVKLSYIDVPVLVHVNAGPLYFEGGPQVSFRVGGSIESDGNTIDDNLDQFKSTSLGYAAGVGFATPMGLSIGVRYNGDISKLVDNDALAGDTRNNLFMLTLAYLLPGR